MDSFNNKSEDLRIIRKVLEGDSNSFRMIVDKYQSYIFKILSKNVPLNRVEELAHEVFIKAYKSLVNFESKSELRHWLSTIAVRSCYDYWKKNSKVKELPFSDFGNESQESIDSIQVNSAEELFKTEMNKTDALDLLERSLNHLSAEDRMVLSLVHLEGYSVVESSELLGWTPAKVKVRAHRSRLKLRKILLDSHLKDGG